MSVRKVQKLLVSELPRLKMFPVAESRALR